MSTVLAARTQRAATNLIHPDFPRPHRLIGSEGFRHVCGDVPLSTFSRWLSEGRIKKPVKIGAHNAWPEVYVAEVAANGTAPKGTH